MAYAENMTLKKINFTRDYNFEHSLNRVKSVIASLTCSKHVFLVEVKLYCRTLNFCTALCSGASEEDTKFLYCTLFWVRSYLLGGS